jgi:hypothetical protein
MLSTDVWQQAQRWKACSAAAADTPSWGTPAAVATTTPDDHRADVSDADLGSPSDWTDSSSYAIGVAAATPPQSQMQAQMPQMPRDKRTGFTRGHIPVYSHSIDPMDAEDWLRTVDGELLSHPVLGAKPNA